MWDTAQQKHYLLDFEFVSFGPYIGDICYLMLTLGPEIRVSHEERLLARYHEKLIASGKVDPTVYTIEKLKTDYAEFFVPRVSTICLIAGLFLQGDLYYRTLRNLESFVEEKGIGIEDVK